MRALKLGATVATCAVSALLMTSCWAAPLFSGSSKDNSNEPQTTETNMNLNTPTSTATSNQNANLDIPEEDPEPEPVETGTYYQRYQLIDPQVGVAVFDAFVPEGWTANVNGNWNVISIGAPGFEEVTLTSPDGMASITIDSCQAYVQQPSGQEGQSFEYYTTYMNYLNAPAFVDRYMDSTFAGQYQMTLDFPVDEETLGMVCQYNDQCVAISNAEGAAITMNGQIGNINSTAEPKEATMCRRQYSLSNGQCLEASCVDAAMTQTISSPYLTEQYVHWRIPYSIVYMAADRESFDRYYENYELIIANSYFTNDFYSAVNYVAHQITSVAMDAKAAASGYVDEDAASTNEKVMGMWDDYINEVDSYNTLDGGTIKTSMYNDVVAQDGDQYFVGSSTSDIPYGFTELSESY